MDPALVSVFLRPMDRFGGESEVTLEAVLSEGRDESARGASASGDGSGAAE